MMRFGSCGLQLSYCLISSSALSSIWLLMKGAKPVLNDAQALTELLRQNLNDSFGAQSGDQRQTIYLHLHTFGDRTRNFWTSSRPNYSGGSFNTGEETWLVTCFDPNEAASSNASCYPSKLFFMNTGCCGKYRRLLWVVKTLSITELCLQARKIKLTGAQQ